MSIDNCQGCDKRLDTDFVEYQEDGTLYCNNCLDEMEEAKEAASVDLVAAYRTLRAERDTLWTALNDAFAALRYIEKYHRRAAAAAMASPHGETKEEGNDP